MAAHNHQKYNPPSGETDPELQEYDRRLQQLESEIQQQSQLEQRQPGERSLNRRLRSVVKIAQWVAIAVGVIFLLRFVTWLASIVIIGAVVWVVYKLFFEPDRS